MSENKDSEIRPGKKEVPADARPVPDKFPYEERKENKKKDEKR
jgi:hypothetical protein